MLKHEIAAVLKDLALPKTNNTREDFYSNPKCSGSSSVQVQLAFIWPVGIVNEGTIIFTRKPSN